MADFLSCCLFPVGAAHRLQHMLAEDLHGVFGVDIADKFVPEHCGDALGAVAHAESGFQLDLLLQMVVFNQLLKDLDHAEGTFQMAGTADANLNNHTIPHLSIPGNPWGLTLLYYKRDRGLCQSSAQKAQNPPSSAYIKL